MPLLVFVAPVNHFDPLGRGALIDRLRQLRGQSAAEPTFVAVEYDSEQHRTIVKLRQRFRQMLAEEWPDLSPEELDTLESSLAYDGDAHREVFPDARTIWLDQGRQVTPEELDGYAQNRLKIYRAHACGPLAGRVPELSQRIRQIAEPAGAGNERDGRFAEMILAGLHEGSPGIAIVGENHANEQFPDTMVTILRGYGVERHRI